MTRTQQIEEDYITEMENCRVIKLVAGATADMMDYSKQNGLFMQNTGNVGEDA